LNHAAFLEESIRSTLNQTFEDFELFIIDDNSDDDSWEIIQGFDDERITAIRNPVRSRAAYGFNETIGKHAKGEFIAIHHSDDVWLPQKLEKQLQFLEAHPEVGAVFTQVEVIDELGGSFSDPNHFYQNAFKQPNRSRLEWLRHFFLEGNCLCHPSVLARKQAMLDAGLYDRRLGQITDFDLWVRLCLRHEIHILDDVLTRFRILRGEANQSGEKSEAYVRVRNEWPVVLGRLLQLHDEADFFAVFPELRQMAVQSENILPFLLAIRATDAEDDFRISFGLRLLYTLFADEVTASSIKEKYNFSYLDLIALSGQVDPFEGTGALKMKQEVDRIKNTVSWQVTKPLRFFANLFKGSK
jgi:glycosyltransferase involved in cell wall biosynthesis